MNKVYVKPVKGFTIINPKNRKPLPTGVYTPVVDSAYFRNRKAEGSITYQKSDPSKKASNKEVLPSDVEKDEKDEKDEKIVKGDKANDNR